MKVSNRLLQRTMMECLWQASLSSILPPSNVLLDSLVRISTRACSGFATDKIGDREEDVQQETKDKDNSNCAASSSKGIWDFHCQEPPFSHESCFNSKYNRSNLKDLSEDYHAQMDSLRTAFKGNAIPVSITEALLQRKGNGFTVDLVGHVLRSVLNDWESALCFFVWIGRQPGYKHTSETMDLMIHILGKANQFVIMWELLERMKKEAFLIRPKTLEVIIRSYVKAGKLKDLVDVFEKAEDFDTGFRTGAFNTLVRILCYEKRVEDCQLIFERLKDTYPPDDKTYSILIHGWCRVNRQTEASRMLEEMLQEGIQPTWGAYTSLIEAFCAKNMVDIAKKLFNHMKNSIIQNLKEAKQAPKTSADLDILNQITAILDFPAYNSLITSLSILGEVDDASKLLERMTIEGFTPYAKTYGCVLEELCKRRKSIEAFELYNRVGETGIFPSLKIHDNLIEMFCSTGHVGMALELWNKIQEKGYNCGHQSYTVLIHGLCYNGLFPEAFEQFKKMIEKGIVPHYKTYRLLLFGFLEANDMERFDELKVIIKYLNGQGIQLLTSRKQ